MNLMSYPFGHGPWAATFGEDNDSIYLMVAARAGSMVEEAAGKPGIQHFHLPNLTHLCLL